MSFGVEEVDAGASPGGRESRRNALNTALNTRKSSASPDNKNGGIYKGLKEALIAACVFCHEFHGIYWD